MQNARTLVEDDIPSEIPESTNMDKLHKAILRYLMENNRTFPINTEKFWENICKTFNITFLVY